MNSEKSIDNSFYVYVHKRNDTNEIFYIGKGKGFRAYRESGRNSYWTRVAKKHGFTIEFLHENISEQEAHRLEVETIKLLKNNNVKLCNMTDGGEGMSGWVASEETRKKYSAAKKGRKWTEETRQKFIASRKGEKRKPLSEEHKKVLSEKKKLAGPLSEQHKKNISLATKGKKKTGRRKNESKNTPDGT